MTKTYPETLELAMLAVQSELTNPIKDATNPHFKSKYATLPEIRNLVTPILAKQGLYITQFVHGELLRTFITHAPTTKSLYADTNLMMDKQTPQGQGSAITYARRYALCAMLNIAADEDDDGQSAEKPKQANRIADYPGVKEDMKDLGYDETVVYNTVIEELETCTDTPTLDLWVKRNKETNRMRGMSKDLKDDVTNRYNTLKTFFQSKGL